VGSIPTTPTIPIFKQPQENNPPEKILPLTRSELCYTLVKKVSNMCAEIFIWGRNGFDMIYEGIAASAGWSSGLLKNRLNYNWRKSIESCSLSSARYLMTPIVWITCRIGMCVGFLASLKCKWWGASLTGRPERPNCKRDKLVDAMKE